MESAQLSTRDRIIETAADIFGKNGFKATTIRMIAGEAGVNVAAVNYHFGDKEKLYAEVMETTFAKGFSRFPSILSGKEAGETPEERLMVFIRGTLYRLISQEGWGGIGGKGRLIIKEMLEPSPPFIRIVDRYIKPHKDALVAIIREIVGQDAPLEKVLLCTVSILGQCVYYVFASTIIERIAPEYLPVEKKIDMIADHVFQFSLGGLEKIKQAKEAL